MQVDRMRVVALVIENQTIVSVGSHGNWVGLRKLFSVDSPVVHPSVSRPLLFKYERDALVRFGDHCFAPEDGVIPKLLGRRGPLRRAAASVVFDDNSHPGFAHAVVNLAQDPDSGLVHLDYDIYALSGRKLQHVHGARRWRRVPIQRGD